MENKVQWPGWEVVQLIGRGSFGAVYEIQRDVLGDVEKAALKAISIPQNVSDFDDLYSEGYDDESIATTYQNYLKSIVAEYTLMRKMNGSSNIVNCDDIRYVQHDDGIGWDIFIKMELLTPLTKALDKNVSEETVMRIAMDMCKALELCKKHDIVHRDIKPQNIFVSPNGDYKLGDFGIAKTVERTMGGTKIGTYKYMAPEVYNNQPYGSTADIYSLGLVLYWLLNERRMPFMPLPPATPKAGQDEESRQRRLSGEPIPAPAHGSDALKKIVLKACAYDPKDRFVSAAEMHEALRQLNGDKVPAPAPQPEPRPGPSSDSVPPVSIPTPADSTLPKVHIRFLDHEGNLLQARSYAKGAKITAPIPPERTDENGTVYEFWRWEPSLPPHANQEMSYRAVYREVYREKPKKEEKKKSPLIWIAVAAVCVIAVVAGLLLGGGRSGPANGPAAESTKAPVSESTKAPTTNPTKAPVAEPTKAPVSESTKAPTTNPTKAPAAEPTKTPEKRPEDYKGKVQLYSTMTEADLDALISCFNKKYPNIEVITTNGSAVELTSRLRGERGNPQGDVMWGGLADSDGQTYSDIFEPWISAHDAENMKGYTTPNGLYSMAHLSTVVFVVNEDLERQLGLNIQSYEDLLNPALKGKIATADPNSSSSAWNNLSNIFAVYGNDTTEAWSYIEKLMPNLVILRSSSGVFKNTKAGEYVVGLTYEDGAVGLVRDGATNIRLQYPTNGTSASCFGTALVKNGPNPENAKLLIDFICSAEGQTALAAYQQGTLRYTNAGYKPPKNAWLKPSNQIKWVTRDVEYLTKNKSAILDHWNTLWAVHGSN